MNNDDEWPGARSITNKSIPNADVFEEEFGAVSVSGAEEGWSEQQGETSLDSSVSAENDDDDDDDDSVDTVMAPPVVGTQKRTGSSGSKRKRKDIDIITETSSSWNAILTRKNELLEQMMEHNISCSVERVFEILHGLPGVRKWSAFHKAAVDHLLADVANRQGFIAFSSIEDKISFLEHRTRTLLDD